MTHAGQQRGSECTLGLQPHPIACSSHMLSVSSLGKDSSEESSGKVQMLMQKNVCDISLYHRLVRNQLQQNNMMARGGEQTCKVQFEPKHPL